MIYSVSWNLALNETKSGDQDSASSSALGVTDLVWTTVQLNVHIKYMPLHIRTGRRMGRGGVSGHRLRVSVADRGDHRHRCCRRHHRLWVVGGVQK